MMLPEEFAHLAKETIIVVDNAKRPSYSATEAASHYPLLIRYQKPLVREKRMIRKRSSRMSNRWESAPIKPTVSECCSLQDQAIASCSKYPTMNLVHLTAAMPLRMPVRSRDDFDSQQQCLTKPGDQSSLINFLDEALAISEILQAH